MTVTWDQRFSNSAANRARLQYSADGGATYTDAPSSTSTGNGNVWINDNTIDLSAFTALNNNANVRFRIVSEFATPTANPTSYAPARPASNYATNGTWRFDMLTVRGVATQPDLTVALSGPASATVGQSYSYSLVVANSGTAAATNVPVLFTLPAGVTYNSAAGTNGFTASQTGGVVTFTGGSITQGTSATLTTTVTPNATGSVTSSPGSATVDPNNTIAESNESNNGSTETITTNVVAPMVNLSVSMGTIAEDSPQTITVSVTTSFSVTGDQTVTLNPTGSATFQTDYFLGTQNNTTITILNGQTQGSTTFNVLNDTQVEGTETATLTISNVTPGLTIGATPSQSITITDDDVAPTPALAVSPTSLTFTTTAGTASAQQSYVVSATALTTDVTVTASAGVEISQTSGGGFTSSLTLPSSTASATLYARLSAGAAVANPFSGTITHVSGSLTATVAISGTVNAANTAPTAPAIANQTATQNQPFSYTVPAFSDNETPNGLTYTATINPVNNFVFDPATRIISGTPTNTGPSNVTIVATDPGSLSALQTFTITVIPPACPQSVTNVNTSATFCTIQDAINAPATINGHTIRVAVGTFPESVTVTKSLTINGAQAGIDPRATGTTARSGGETVVTAPVNNTANGNLFTIKAQNVIIDGFTFDGDNPTVTGGLSVSGTDINTARAISNGSDGNFNFDPDGLVVRNNVIKNFARFGLTLFFNLREPEFVPASLVTDNALATRNVFSNIRQWCVYAENNNYVSVIDNKIVGGVRGGILVSSYFTANGGGIIPQVTGNDVETERRGMFYNLFFQNGTPYTVANNTFRSSGSTNTAVIASSLQNNGHVLINNTITSGATTGFYVWNVPAGLLISGGSVDGATRRAVLATNRETEFGFGDALPTNSLTLSGVTITNSLVGVQVLDNAANTNSASVTATITGNTQITGTGAFTAIGISGTDASANINNNASSFSGNGSGVGVDVNGGTAGVTTSRITSFGTGINVSNGGQLTGVTNSSVAGNSTNGISYAADAGATQGAITTNFLAGNANKAIVNGLASTTINANCNWFGPPSTTANPTYVTGNVTATQQLANGTDEDGGAPGFQNTSCFTPVAAVAPILTATAPANPQGGSVNASYCVGENPTVNSDCTTGVNSFTVQALSDGSTTVTTGSSVQITQGAGTYFVYATCTQNGTTSPVSATTTIRVQPNVSSFTSNKATYCVGEAVSLTALGCNVAASPQAQLYFVRLRALDGSGNRNQGVVDLAYGATTYTFTPSFAPTVATAYTFTAECVNGGTGNVCVVKDLTITVTPAPTATLSASGTLTCAQTSVTLTAGGGQTYAFAGPGLVSQDPASGTAVANAGGTYSVTVTSAGGCTSTATTTVATSNTLAAPDFFTQFDQSYQGGVQSVTVGQNTGTVTFQFSNCQGGTVNWSGQDGSSGTGNIVAMTTQPGTLTYTGTCTLNSCLSPASSVTVTTTAANTPPVATANANQTATVGVPFTYTVNAFTDSQTPSGLTYMASIDPVNGFTFDPATRIISGMPSMSGVSSVTVTATDPGSLSASTSFTITVNPAPVVVTPLSLTLTANPMMILTTGTTTLSATVSGGSTPYSYAFSGPGTITPSGNTATVSGLSAGVQTFTVLVTDATTPTSQTISGMVSVTVSQANTPPVATANANQTATVGVPFSYTVNAFTDSETPSGLTYSASIDPTNGFNFDPATRIISGTPSVSGVSSVTVVGTDPGSLSASTSFTIMVNPAPVTPTAPFAITGVTTLDCTPVANRINVNFNPRYAGLNGQSISFQVVNELSPTTASGPYTLQLYPDNPTIILKAVQSGTAGETSFNYNWLAACNSLSMVGSTNTPPTVANAIPPQSATVNQAFSYVIPANTFTDAETPNQLTLSVTGLPPGLSFTGPATISGTPTSSAGSPYSVTVKATDPGSLSVSTTFTITVSPAASMTTTSPFAITSVTTLDCTPVANRITINFNPQYAGLNGQTISFQVLNELSPTTAPGPYSLTLYPDNPVITLKAIQSGTTGEATFFYNWLAACNSLSMVTPNNTAPTTTGIANQSGTVNQGFSLNVASSFSDAETPNNLSYSAAGLPAGLSLSGSTISGTPSMSGVSTVTVTATDPGNLSVATSFSLTVSPAASMTGTPPTAPFSITGVTTVSCTVISAGQREVRFTPQYAGTTNQPISFSVVNELSPTTAPGPYTLRLYNDNPTITLKATQSGTAGESSFSYNWLAACNGGSGARVGVEPVATLQVRVLGNPVQNGQVRVEVRGAAGVPLRLLLTDVRGQTIGSHTVKQAGSLEQHTFEIGRQPGGVLLLRASTPGQSQTLKVLKTD